MSTPNGPGARPARIADVAAAVGVAKSTVSRALTRPEMVSVELRERILSTAATLGYRPNLHARSLILQSSNFVGLLVPDVTNSYFGGVIRGSQDEANRRGYRQVVLDTHELGSLESEYLDDLAGTLSGAVLASPRIDADDLRSSVLPTVTLNRQVAGIPSVSIDAASAMGSAIDHVVSLGHRSVVYVGGDESSMTEQGRWEALHAAAEKRGISSQRIGTHHASYQEGGAAADAVLATNATAAFFRNDLLAIGALQRFEERGIRVPDQISVVGCDDIFGASFCHPPLTTIAAPVEQAGRMAMGMLLDRIENKSTQAGASHLTTHLTIRRSTGPAPVSAPLLT